MSADEPAESSPPQPAGLKPHHLAIGLGIGIAVFTVALRRRAADHRVARRQRRSTARSSSTSPGRCKLAFYTVIPVMIVWGAFRFADRMKNWERGRPAPTPADDDEERQAPLRRLPRRRLHAHAAARPGRRADALDDLLRVPRPARRHDGARDRPPAAREPEVPARPHLPGVRLRRRRRRARVRRRRAVGDRPPLRAAAVPHPHQDQARARRHPRHVPRHRRSAASPPRCSASPCRRPVPARTWTTRSGASSASR